MKEQGDAGDRRTEARKVGANVEMLSVLRFFAAYEGFGGVQRARCLKHGKERLAVNVSRPMKRRPHMIWKRRVSQPSVPAKRRTHWHCSPVDV